MYAGKQNRGLKFTPENGMQVDVTGKIGVYVDDGKYQLYADKMERYGLGAIYEQFERLKAELQELGMFSEEYKQPIPPFAKKVGVVTALGSDALNDIRKIARERNPYVELLVCHTAVQGASAPASIANALARMGNTDVDLIILARGGGSYENLKEFNDRMVAQAIFDCPIPVITGIGHETHFTIADFVADLRAPTPTGAAVKAFFEYDRFRETLSQYAETLTDEMNAIIEDHRNRTEGYRSRLTLMSPDRRIRELRMTSSLQAERLRAAMQALLSEQRGQIRAAERDLADGMDHVLLREKHRLSLLATRLDAASPLKRLSAGFGLVENTEGKRVRSVRELRTGEEIHVYFTDGTATAGVKDIRKKNWGSAGGEETS